MNHNVGVENKKDEIDDESSVMHELKVENINEMYTGLSNFIIGENGLATRSKKRVMFPPNSRLLLDEDKLILVVRLLHFER